MCARCAGAAVDVQRDETQADAPKPCAIKPTVSPTVVHEVAVSGKDIVEWVTNMISAIAESSGHGNAHAIPEISVHASGSADAVKLSGSVRSEIWVPKVVLRKGDKLSAGDAAIIAKYVRLTREHEEAHVANAVTQLTRALCAGNGLPAPSAATAVNAILCDDLATADEQLDAKSGTDEWVYNDDQTAVTDIRFVGAKANYHDKNCSFL